MNQDDARIAFDALRYEQAVILAERGYRLAIERESLSDDSIVYMARNPELSGCKSHGSTVVEAIHNLREARIDYINCLLEDGLDVPQPHFWNKQGIPLVFYSFTDGALTIDES